MCVAVAPSGHVKTGPPVPLDRFHRRSAKPFRKNGRGNERPPVQRVTDPGADNLQPAVEIGPPNRNKGAAVCISDTDVDGEKSRNVLCSKEEDDMEEHVAVLGVFPLLPGGAVFAIVVIVVVVVV